MKRIRVLLAFSLSQLAPSCAQRGPANQTEQPAVLHPTSESQTLPATRKAEPAPPQKEARTAAPTESLSEPSTATPPSLASTFSPPKGPSPPPLYGDDGTPLGQTEEKPDVESPWFQHCARTLFNSIVADDVELALPCFFPKVAYAQVKAIQDPDTDWERRLKSAFEKDIHVYHMSLGRYRDEAKFSAVRVNPSSTKWVKPGEEGNRLGYFRTMRSVLVYTDDQRRARELGVLTMISWRGQWAVVHLAPFK
jgi:hypothetical protein